MADEPQDPKEAIEKLLKSLSSNLEAGPGFEKRVLTLVAGVAVALAFVTSSR